MNQAESNNNQWGSTLWKLLKMIWRLTFRKFRLGEQRKNKQGIHIASICCQTNELVHLRPAALWWQSKSYWSPTGYFYVVVSPRCSLIMKALNDTKLSILFRKRSNTSDTPLFCSFRAFWAPVELALPTLPHPPRGALEVYWLAFCRWCGSDTTARLL